MSVRLKTHWFQEGRVRGPEEQASVIAAAIWKTATNGLDGLRKARFSVDVGVPYIAVLTEFLVFLVTVADRLAYLEAEKLAAGNPTPVATGADTSPGVASGPLKVDAAWRQAFTVGLARRLADIYQENLDRLLGPLPATKGEGAAGDIDGGKARAGSGGDSGIDRGGVDTTHGQAFVTRLNIRMGEYADFGFSDAGPAFAFLRYFGTCIEEVLPNVEDRRWALDQVMALQAPEAVEIVTRGMFGVMGRDDAKPRKAGTRSTGD